jgi:predicted NAD/FAD-dependent oxidoreductase
MSVPPVACHRVARIAVVGAGIAGLAYPRTLLNQGLRARVFERDLCPGGRLATRRVESLSFDHGVQYFSTQDARFEPVVRQWEAAGIVAPWDGRTVALAGRGPGEEVASAHRYVGVPTMEAVAIHLARGLDIQLGAGVAQIRCDAGQWRLTGERGGELDEAGFDAVVLAMPSAAAIILLKDLSDLVPRISTVNWDSCWAVMLGLARPSGINFDAAFVSDDPILGWIARESSKPMRSLRPGAAETWILHAHPAWSGAYLEMPEAEATRWMQRAFAARLGRPLVQSTVAAHRWRWALPVNPLPEPFLFDERLAIGLAGDWCGGPRVEGAYLSGVALAQALAS